MDQGTKDSLPMATLKVRVPSIIRLFKRMILSSTSDAGNIQLLMERAEQSIKTGIGSKVTSRMGPETDMVAISSIGILGTRESGRTIAFMDMESYTEIMIFSSREGLKMA